MKVYNNSDGVLVLPEVDVNKCSHCGMCIAQCSFLEERVDGSIRVKDRCYITCEELDSFNTAEGLCIQKALSRKNCSVISREGKVSVSDIKKYIAEELTKYAFPRPQYVDFKWQYFIPDTSDSVEGWSQYKYKSCREAEMAGVRELERVIFNHIDAFIGKILLEYKYKVLTPLIEYNESPNNYYYHHVTELKRYLKTLMYEISEVTGKLVLADSDIDRLDLTPDLGYNSKKIEGFSKIEEWTGMLKGNLHAASYYDSWIDTMDNYESRTRYAFKALEAVLEIVGEINDRARESDSIPGHFKSVVEREYSEVVKPIETAIHDIAALISNNL